MTEQTVLHKQLELEADMLTPISIYHALEGKQKILFESSAKHEESGRYSFIAASPVATLIAKNQILTYKKGDKCIELNSLHPFEELKKFLPYVKGDYPFSFYGGAIGYIGYETAFYHEQIGDVLVDPIDMPDMHLLFFDTFVVMDHVKQTLTIATIDLFQEGLTEAILDERIERIQKQLTKPLQPFLEQVDALQFIPSMTQDAYCQMVEEGKRHIEAGDIFQIVLSQRFSAQYDGNPMALYRQLRTANPSPYMYYIDFDGYTVLGTSPESLVKVSKRQVTTNPIAGTRPRGKDAKQDDVIAEGLLQDEKELAEHRMLVDLGRNDVGRLCEIGSVSVPKYMVIERYKYVMHLVSEVTGTFRPAIHPLDVVASCLPAGTVSGAPKIRAMQLINDFEHVKRGVYAGAIGYLSISGDLDLALAIRTMVVKDGKAHVQAGAGVVHHSNPISEYEETLNKAKALLEVIS